jgi:hypothetical protein
MPSAASAPVSLLPAGLSQAIAKLSTDGVRLYDTMRAPDYPLPVA